MQRRIPTRAMFWITLMGVPALSSYTMLRPSFGDYTSSPQSLSGRFYSQRLFCEDCDVAVLDDSPQPTEHGVRTYAIDPVQAERLWQLSAELTGINAFCTAK